MIIIVNRIQWRCWIWKNEQTKNQWPKWYIVFFFGDWKNRFSSMMMMILMMMMVFYSRNKKLIGVKKMIIFPREKRKKILFFQSRTWTVFLNKKKKSEILKFSPYQKIYMSARQSLIKFSLSVSVCVSGVNDILGNENWWWTQLNRKRERERRKSNTPCICNWEKSINFGKKNSFSSLISSTTSRIIIIIISNEFPPNGQKDMTIIIIVL